MTPWFSQPFNPRPVPDAFDDCSSCLQIRPATSGDLTRLAEIIADSFHSPNGMWGWAYPLLRLGIYEDLRNRLHSPSPHHMCLVAVDSTNGNDNLVGTVELGLRLSDPWKPGGKRFPYLSNLAVCPSYRRRGAAKQLLISSERVALAWGFQDIYLHVLENNHTARQLYFKLGYRVHKVESNWSTFILGRSQQMFLHKRLSADSIS